MGDPWRVCIFFDAFPHQIREFFLHSTMHTYGLIGKKLTHSFSKTYFGNKFKKARMQDYEYVNFELKQIEDFTDLIAEKQSIKGLNVTIPYKEAILPYLDEISSKADRVQAVNTIQIRDGKLIGYNTDVYGFENSLSKTLSWTDMKKALILGTGGASKAIRYVLEELEIEYQLVSRTASDDTIQYEDLGEKEIKEVQLIVNTTPLGMFPNIDDAPDIPYQFLGPRHLLYDLIYNPEKSLFLTMGEEQGARIKNGYDMLVLQANRSWKIWNQKAKSTDK